MQNRSTPVPTFRALVEYAIDHNITTRKALAIAGECDEETVRRWVCGQVPRLNHFRALISRNSLLPPTLKTQMLEWFASITDFSVLSQATVDPARLDQDGDGQVSGRDVNTLTVQAVSGAVVTLERCQSALKDGRMSEQERSEIRNAAYGLREKADLILKAIDFEDSGSLKIAR